MAACLAGHLAVPGRQYVQHFVGGTFQVHDRVITRHSPRTAAPYSAMIDVNGR